MARLTTKGVLQYLSLLLMVALASTQQPSCPNNLAVYNPNIRTSCVNGTFFIVPVPTATVKSAIAPYTLLPLPTSDTTLFPHGFPAGMWPVLVTIAIQNDIRGGPLQMPALLSGGIQVPYVDRLGDKKSPFVFGVKEYVGGYDGSDVGGYVPAIVSTLGGITVFVAEFVPDTGPYQQISSAPPEYFAQIKDVIVPNPISGPGVILEAVDTDFFTVPTSTYTAHTFHELISQPQIGTNGLCIRNPIYFNQTFTMPVFRNGTVILYSPGGAFPGVYNSIQGYSASGENVGSNPEPCASSAAKMDPKALA